MNDQPSYYAILTAQVRYDNRLTLMQKIMYAEITALSNKNKYCHASNGYFAKLYDCTSQTISKSITTLQRLGYLYVEVIRTKDGTTRKIYPIDPVVINDKGGSNELLTGVVNKYYQNNTSDNTINIEREETEKQVINYLLKTFGNDFEIRPTGKYRKYIKDLIDEGKTLEQFKTVIDRRNKDYRSGAIQQYLVEPDVLFKPDLFTKELNAAKAKKVTKSSSQRMNGEKIDNDKYKSITGL